MGPFSRLKIFFLLHSREYEKILKLTACDLLDPKESADKIRYQALSAFYLESYIQSRKCYEILSKRNKAVPADYARLAYIYARHNQKENAIISWCRALELDKNQKTSKLALDYIKKKGREIGLFEDEYIKKISTKQPVYLPFKSIFQGAAVGCLIAAFIFLAVVQGPRWYHSIQEKRYRSDLNKVLIDEYNPTVLSDYPEEGKEFSYTENEVRKMFDTAKNKIANGDENQAIVLMNQLNRSNASLNVKAKLELLSGFLQEPDYSTFKSNFDYLTVKKMPEIYEGVYVMWHGKIVNSAIADGKTGFNLVLGDDSEGYIEGIIPVTYSKALIAENGTYARVFGQVRAVNNGKIRIDGRILIRD